MASVKGRSEVKSFIAGLPEALVNRVLRGAGRAAADVVAGEAKARSIRSEEHTSELQSLMRISYAVFCLKKKKIKRKPVHTPFNIAHLGPLILLVALLAV